MIREIYQCVAIEHDYRLVLLAVFLCFFASYTTLNLLQRAKEAPDEAGRHWAMLTAVSGGCGVWATHFVAMIAYDPGMPMTFDVLLTAFSVFVAIVVVGAGFALWLGSDGVWGHAVAGVIVAIGVLVMHLIGMAAVRLQGTISYEPRFLVLAGVLGTVFGIATCLAMRATDHRAQLAKGTVLFTLGICLTHFTAMAGLIVEYDPTIVVPTYAVPKIYIVLGVTLAVGLLLALTLASALADRRMARQFSLEVRRLRDLANAGRDGIVILDPQGRILEANYSFLQVVGRDLEVLRGLSLKHCFRNFDFDKHWAQLCEGGSIFDKGVAIHACEQETNVEIELYRQTGLEIAYAVAIVRGRGTE